MIWVRVNIPIPKCLVKFYFWWHFTERSQEICDSFKIDKDTFLNAKVARAEGYPRV